MVPVSASTKQNLDLLLEMILLVADMQDLKANPTRPAMGTVIEAKLDRGRGPVATVLVRNGTLRVGDFFICGEVFGKVRAMINDRGDADSRSASLPCRSKCWVSMPCPKPATSSRWSPIPPRPSRSSCTAKPRRAKWRWPRTSRLTLEQLHKQMAQGEVKELPIILKADVGGSAEVLRETLAEALHRQGQGARAALRRGRHQRIGRAAGVGFERDHHRLQRAAGARMPRRAAEQEKVDIRLHTIIYNLTDEIKKAMTGLLAPVFKEVYRGKAEVRETFRVTKVGTVAGCLVMDGNITRDCMFALLRDNVVVHTGKIGSLQRFKDDVSEVRSGMECGITLENYADVKAGDIIEAFVTGEGDRAKSPDGMAAIGVLTLELRLEHCAFAEGQAARGEEPEGPACGTSSMWRWRKSITRTLAARGHRRGDRFLGPRPRRRSAAARGGGSRRMCSAADAGRRKY